MTASGTTSSPPRRDRGSIVHWGSLIIAVFALALAGLTLYFQFFHNTKSLVAVFATSTFGDTPSVKYVIVNSGRTACLLLDAEAFEYHPVTNPSPYGEFRIGRPPIQPPEEEWPVLLAPGEMVVLELAFNYSGEDDEDSPEREIHIVFNCLDATGRTHNVIDRLEWTYHHMSLTVHQGVQSFGVKRLGDKTLHDTLTLIGR